MNTSYPPHAMCLCGHPLEIHLVPDYADHNRRVCFVTPCGCEGAVPVCIECREPADDLIAGLWCDACAEAAGEAGLVAEYHHLGRAR